MYTVHGSGSEIEEGFVVWTQS